MKSNLILSLLIAGTIMAGNISASITSSDANLVIWLNDAANNYNTTTNVWSDSSSAGNDVGEVTSSLDGTYSGGSSYNPSAGTFNSFARTGVSIADNGIMGATGLNSSTGFSELTIFGLYSVSIASGSTRPFGIGSKTMEGTTNNFDRFHMATDPSIRFDDGANTYTYSHGTSLVLRVTKLSAGQVWDGYYDTSTGNIVYELSNVTVGSGATNGTSGSTFVTQTDDLYFGEIGANPTVSDGTASTYEIVEFAMYNIALSDADIQNIADTIAVPEPSTYALLAGIGALSIVILRRRGSKS